MSFLRTYTTFFKFLLAYRLRFILFVFFLILLGVTESIQPYFYKLFVDAAPSGSYQQLFNVLCLYIGVRVANLVVDIITYTLGDSVLIPASTDARTSVVKKIQDLDLSFHHSKSTGSMISAIKRGDGAFFNLFHSLNELSRIVVNFVLILIFFGYMNWIIAVMMLVSFVINLVIAKYVISYNMRKRNEFNKSEDIISGVITDNLINYETVKLFAKEEWELNRLRGNFKDWISKLWGYANTFRAIDVSVGTMGNLGLFLILLFTLEQTTNAKFSLGEFVLILGFVNSFYPKFFHLIFNFRDLAKHYADIENYFKVLDDEPSVKDPKKPKTLKYLSGEIKFNHVSFSYPEGKSGAVSDFDLTIKSCQSVAFVGESGVGKTTLIKLLLRFYDVDHGSIKIDDVDIRDFKKSYLRSLMGVVPQDPILFNDTIKYNITYGAKNVTSSFLRAATKMANLDSFIESLPHKYETVVGERGVKLSGGQKQRLAIARMILSNPKIVIFDEATSQLDSDSEKKIQDAFWKASKNKTTIIIAHRLSTVVKADKIVVMSKGKIAEIGSHHELINRENGLYKHFWDLQKLDA